MLPQTEVTLNLLRRSNAKPTVSAYAHLCGPFDHNRMPLAPMGCEIQIHEKMDKRGTWAYHCLDGWYLNTSQDHYQVHNCHVKSTKAEQLSNTVHVCHKSITNPALTPHDKLMLALANCKAALAGLSSSPADTQAKDLQQLIQLTEHKLNPSTTPTMSPAQPPEDTPFPRVQPRVQPTVQPPDLPSPVTHPPTRVPRVSPASNLPQRQAVA